MSLRLLRNCSLVIAIIAVGDGCSGGSGGMDMIGAPDLSIVHRIFVTSLDYVGDFGDLHGADSNCMTQVGVAGIGGNWLAWMSDSSMNAIDRINDVGPWYRLDGYRVFDNKAQMTGLPQAPIDVDENGIVDHGEDVWTGTAVGGMAAPGGMAIDCMDWSTSGMNATGTPPVAVVGSTDFKDMQWTNKGTDNCGALQRIYCVEQ
jgi:hypothetical protein